MADNENTSAAALTLSNGLQMPILGFGTSKVAPGETARAILAAVEAGYRHIDCAALYGNEAEIGQVLKEILAEGKVRRQELFIVSKVWNTCHKPENVRRSCEQTLRDLQLEYLDLYLVHWPVAFEFTGIPIENAVPKDPISGAVKFEATSLQQTWEAMEDLVSAGLVRSIGLSNYSLAQILDTLTYAKVKPTVNQVEAHPYFSRTELIEESRRFGIQTTAYAPLGSGHTGPLQDMVVSRIARNHKRSNAQVLIRWSVQRGVAVIPKSSSEARILENYAVNDFVLAEREMAELAALDRQMMFCDPREYFGFPLTV